MNHLNLSQPPKPKDFSRFEDFEQAAQLYETFKLKENQLNALISQKLPQETFDKEMEKLGFFKNSLDDMFGEHAFIVKFILDFQIFQDFCLEHFFYHLRPKDEVCLLPEMLDDPIEIPQTWLELKNHENNIINYSLNFFKALHQNKITNDKFQNVLENTEFQQFGRIWYEWIFENLTLQIQHPELAQEISNFLEKNPLIKNSSETKIFINFLKNL